MAGKEKFKLWFSICGLLLSHSALMAESWVGADEANARFFGDSTSGGGSAYNYLALRDHPGPSGVPLGGIGAGCVQFAPDGHFTRTGGINNWFTDCATQFRQQNTALENGHFLVVWNRPAKGTPVVRRLQRDSLKTCGISAFSHSVYRGLFPVAETYFTEDSGNTVSAASVRMWSGLVPHTLNDSTIPCFWVEVTLANNMNSAESAVAFSWADLLGRGLLEPKDPKTIPVSPFACSPADFKEIPRQATAGKPAAAGDWQGVMQTVKEPLPAPTKLTFQTGVSQVMILAEPQKDAQISILPAYRLDKGAEAWAGFISNGTFAAANESDLSGSGTTPSASVVAIKAKVPNGGKRTFRFLVTWYAPPVTPDPARGKDERYRYGIGDYGTWYQNHFKKIDDVASYAIAGRQRVWDGIRAWQDPILNSNMPDWLQFKLINSAYTLYCNTILNRAGDFSVMEGGMGGQAATMDVRNIVHPLYQKFFPMLNRHELRMFAASQEPVVYVNGQKNATPLRIGAISHMLGNYFVGLATTNYPGPCVRDVNMDGTCGFIMQIVKDYEQTGDLAWLRENADIIRKALVYLKTNIVDERGIPNGRATYDDYHHPEVFAYNASMFLMGLEAAVRAGHALNDDALVADAEKMRATAREGYRSLWNGRFFAYGAKKGSKELINDRFHQGQVGGQSLTRFCGWGDIVPMPMLNAVFTSQCKLVLSKVPDYYADKVWDLEMNRGVDNPGSRCWPFQLEAFTAMPMIQAGWIEDGFDIMRHIQLVHLRKGWTWSQNLWNPSELTRMDAPVTWMILDNLAGAALNVPEQRLILGPGLIPGENRLTVPLYFSDFWAVLDYQPQAGKASLTITRTIGDKVITFNKLTGLPMGRSSTESKTISIPPFTVKTGAVLDLAPYLDVIGPPVLRQAVLPRANQVPFVNCPL